MSEDANKVTCEDFQNQLAGMIESGVDVANHPHARTCGVCCGLIRELYRIAENSRHFRFETDESEGDDWSEST